MKPIWQSLVLATSLLALAGAITFAVTRSRPPEPAIPAQRTVEESLSSLDARLSEVLERLERLESSLAALERRPKAVPRETATLPALAADPEAPAAGARRLSAPGQGAEEEGLRTYIHQVIQEEREERRQEEERRRIEEKRTWEELGQGPYGDFNLRVNCMTRVLGLDDRQKQRYFEILSHYSTRLQESAKGLNKLDPESLRAYEERKQQVLAEFETVALQAFTPAQAQQYRELPSSAKSPGPESAKTLTLLVTRAE